MSPSSSVPASPASAGMPVKHCDGSEKLQAWAGCCSMAGGRCEAGRQREERTRQLSSQGVAGASTALSTPGAALVEQKEMVRVVFPHATRASIAPASRVPMGCVPLHGDEPLGSEIPPALRLTALLLAAGGVWKLPCSPRPPSPSGCSSRGAIGSLTLRCPSVLP